MTETANDRVRKVKSILVTQEAPTDANSPYLKLAEKFNLKIAPHPWMQQGPPGTPPAKGELKEQAPSKGANEAAGKEEGK